MIKVDDNYCKASFLVKDLEVKEIDINYVEDFTMNLVDQYRYISIRLNSIINNLYSCRSNLFCKSINNESKILQTSLSKMPKYEDELEHNLSSQDDEFIHKLGDIQITDVHFGTTFGQVCNQDKDVFEPENIDYSMHQNPFKDPFKNEE
mmetsp:Transcript_19488/g.17266  ORF Transcript_19488/g.17266 Transcript_19488/m.17266 type:complete len:149 (+) Transcript_19488:467-913(+)